MGETLSVYGRIHARSEWGYVVLFVAIFVKSVFF